MQVSSGPLTQTDDGWPSHVRPLATLGTIVLWLAAWEARAARSHPAALACPAVSPAWCAALLCLVVASSCRHVQSGLCCMFCCCRRCVFLVEAGASSGPKDCCVGRWCHRLLLLYYLSWCCLGSCCDCTRCEPVGKLLATSFGAICRFGFCY